MKSKIALTAGVVLVTCMMFFSIEEKAEAASKDKKQDLGKLIEALRKERAAVEKRKQKQDERERQLRLFEKELEKINLKNKKSREEIEGREKALQKKIDDLTLDKQIVETYETVEAEQASVLILELYKKDPVQVARLMRRLPGEKAGEILNAMVVSEPDKAAILAKKVLDYYKVEKNKKQ